MSYLCDEVEPPVASKRHRSETDEESTAEGCTRSTRSRRSKDRLVISKSSLYYRRMEQLFFAASPARDDAPQIVRFGNTSLHREFSEPNIYVIENFLSVSDLTYLREQINKGRFRRSYVDLIASAPDDDDDVAGGGRGEGNGKTIVDDHRTSTFMSFDKQQDSRIAAIEKRAAELMGCWSTLNVEPLQLVRYTPGQYFNVHHDLADYNDENGEVNLPPKSLFHKRRIVTIFCYLNEVEEGGETSFPSCPIDEHDTHPTAAGTTTTPTATTNNSPRLPTPDRVEAEQDFVEPETHTASLMSSSLSTAANTTATTSMTCQCLNSSSLSSSSVLTIQPKPGRAVLWSNVLSNGLPDPRTIHAGLPVQKGIKYGLNIWICEN